MILSQLGGSFVFPKRLFGKKLARPKKKLEVIKWRRFMFMVLHNVRIFRDIPKITKNEHV